MKHKILYITLTAFILVITLGGFIGFHLFAPLKINDEGANPINHDIWSDLLNKHVNSGYVDYRGFAKDDEALDFYLDRVSAHPPSKSWTKDQKLAYWINAYNAYTIRLVLDYYPVESVKDISSTIQVPFINSPWDINFIKIGNKTISLNGIEHRILRRVFEEPRIHFAIVCASKSCPKLRNEAYVADKLDNQLDQQAIDFINNPTKNRITGDNIKLSKIFQWFEGDFTNHGTLVDFLNKYSKTPVSSQARIEHFEYDWTLNEEQVSY